ncbi:MAG: hypothetical protein R3C68_07795 [Myxococcota bacterium]
MDINEVIRWGVFGLLTVAMLTAFLGGWLTRVSGSWRDGDRHIELEQFGPWVNGHCSRVGGREIYKGTAFFGRLKLSRMDDGTDHLKAVGFEAEAIPLLKGQIMASLDLRLEEGDTLRGVFEGRRFKFGEEPLRITSVTRVAPTPRVWQRIPSAPVLKT